MWCASHIYTQPNRSILDFLSSHPLLSKGLYRVKDLDGVDWDDLYGRQLDYYRHGLPPGGLVVVREFCDSIDGDWAKIYLANGQPVILWDEIGIRDDTPVILPPCLPIYGFGKLYMNESDKGYPPAEFLRFLKHLSKTMNSTVCFYYHETGAELAVSQEYAWVFGKDECVYVYYGSDYEQYFEEKILIYTGSEVREVPIKGKWPEIAPVLRFTMNHLGLNMAQSAFALHNRKFNWDKHKFPKETFWHKLFQ